MPKPAGTDTHTKMRVFTLDNMYLLSQIGVVLMGLAVFVTGKLVADRETEKSARLTRELEQKTEEVRKKQEPRQLDFEKFSNALKGKASAEVEILYQPDQKKG